MVELPGNQMDEATLIKLLGDWYKMNDELKRLRAKEMALRQTLFAHYFPVPEEGTNSYELPDGWVLKGKHTINRTIDLGALVALQPQFKERGLSVDKLVESKPSLVKREYNKLTAEERHLFDQALVVKPGSPALEVVLPKRGKGGAYAGHDNS